MLSYGRLVTNRVKASPLCSVDCSQLRVTGGIGYRSRLVVDRLNHRRFSDAFRTHEEQATKRAAKSWNSTSNTAVDVRAVPGPLDLSVPSTSQLTRQSQLSKFLQGFELSIKRQLFQHDFVAERPDPRFSDLLATITENQRDLRDIISIQSSDSNEELITAVISELCINQPSTLCKNLPWLLSDSDDCGLSRLRTARSIHIMYYMYHHFLLEGLPSASIAPEFYECLLAMTAIRGESWGHRLLATMPMYVLKQRCPTHLRERLTAAYGPKLLAEHYEHHLLRVQQLAAQNQFAAALGVLQEMRVFALVPRTVEYYNTIHVLLALAERFCSKEDAATIVSQFIMLPGIVKVTALCRLVLQFAVKMGLPGSVREVSYKIMQSGYPPPTVIMDVQSAMKQLKMYADDADPILTTRNRGMSIERSYAVNNTLIRMRLQRIEKGQTDIWRDMLDVLQDHANVSCLVQLGLTDHVLNPQLPFIDSQALGIILWQYFTENEHDDHTVMRVYDRFKALLQTDSEMVRKACFPDAHVFNCFIATFGRMSKERLDDALDILAELTHHHEPHRNKPQSLPKTMLNPRWLHNGPNGRTLSLLTYALVRHGQLQAAERCLAEIWRKWPKQWNYPCDILIKAYMQVGQISRAGWLLTRKINAGFEVTESTMSALAATRSKLKSAGKRRKRRGFDWNHSADDESGLHFSDELDEVDNRSWMEPIEGTESIELHRQPR